MLQEGYVQLILSSEHLRYAFHSGVVDKKGIDRAGAIEYVTIR